MAHVTEALLHGCNYGGNPFIALVEVKKFFLAVDEAVLCGSW
jgi:hypothetical protein